MLVFIMYNMKHKKELALLITQQVFFNNHNIIIEATKKCNVINNKIPRIFLDVTRITIHT